MSWRASFRPLRVTARLRTAIICDEWLPLDGIIHAQAMRNAFGWPDRSLPGGDAHDQDPLPPRSMPLAKRGGFGEWWYACSFAQPQPWWRAEGEDHWNKRFDASLATLVDFAGKREKVIVEQGRYRAYHMPVYYKVADKIEWYCVGDAETIQMLLGTVGAIGKKRAYGWGRVSEWFVEPCEEDYSEWRDNRPTRALPLSAGKQGGVFNIRHYGLHPPYYGASSQKRVIMP